MADIEFEDLVVTYADIEDGKWSQEVPVGDYTVVETGAEVDGYTLTTTYSGTATVAEDGEATLTVTNVYEVATGTLKLVKEYSGLKGDDKVPADAKFTISGTPTADIEFEDLVVTYADIEDGNWSQEVPVGTYTVVEEGAEVDGYTLTTTYSDDAVVEEDGEATLTVTNVYEVATGTLKLVKEYSGLQDGDVMPADAKFTISGTPVADTEFEDLVVTYADIEDGNWSQEVPVGTYTVVEEGAEVTGYKLETTYSDDAVVEEDGEATLTVTNVYTIITFELKVTKVWDDEDDKYGVRPDKAVVDLYADGEKIDTVELTEDNLTHTFVVPQYKNGELIKYTVDEQALVAGYVKSIDGDAEKGFTVTNTFKPVEGDPPVKKVIKSNTENVPTETFVFTLTAKDASYPMPEEAGGKSSMTVEIEMPGEPDWKEFGVITFIEEGTYVYTITEEPGSTPGYTYDDNEITITYVVKANEETNELEVTKTVENKNTGEKQELEGKESGNIDYFVFTNEYTVVEVKVTKVWDDADDQDGIRPDSITVKLLADGEDAGVDPLTLNEKNKWTGTWTDLPKTDASGEEIEYTIEEVKTAVITGTDKAGEYEIEIKDADGEFTITNTHTPELIDINVTKVWDDEDDEDGVRPESIKVTLKADGKAVDSVEITEADGWKHTFTDLPKYKDGKEIKYTVEEDKIDKYDTTIEGDAENGFTITNTHIIPPPTGDSANPIIWAGVLVVALACLAFVVIPRRKKEEE